MSSLEHLVNNSPLYQQHAQSPQGQNAQWYGRADSAKLPQDGYFLTGNKTPGFGGGSSPYGFVMQNGNVLGRVKL